MRTRWLQRTHAIASTCARKTSVRRLSVPPSRFKSCLIQIDQEPNPSNINFASYSPSLIFMLSLETLKMYMYVELNQNGEVIRTTSRVHRTFPISNEYENYTLSQFVLNREFQFTSDTSIFSHSHTQLRL